MRYVFEREGTSRRGWYAVFAASANEPGYGKLWLPVDEADTWDRILVEATPVGDALSTAAVRILERHEIKTLRRERNELRRENERLRHEYRRLVEQRALRTAKIIYSD